MLWRIALAEIEIDALGIADATVAPETAEQDPYRSIQIHDFTGFKFVNSYASPSYPLTPLYSPVLSLQHCGGAHGADTKDTGTCLPISRSSPVA